MRTGLNEEKLEKMRDYENSDLSAREKAALRLADKLAFDHTGIDADFMHTLKLEFDDDELVDLGMTIAFLFGWGRFVEAFGILPDALATDQD
jgi:alkylhydroperoxidase family enzyme